MKVAPRPALAFIAWGAYVLVFIGLFAAFGVDYDAVADSSANVLKAVVAPVGAAMLVMIALTTRWGWWRAVMRDHPIVGHRWMLSIPVLMGCGIVAGLAAVSWDKVDAGVAATLFAGCALVGFGEEICTRGLALVGFRCGLSEVQAWLATCGLSRSSLAGRHAHDHALRPGHRRAGPGSAVRGVTSPASPGARRRRGEESAF